jgi:DNA-3-methyladenine glycosylase
MSISLPARCTLGHRDALESWGEVPSYLLELNALDLAPRLIGAVLLVDGVGGTVVETEAYLRSDPASHSFRGPTTANAPMFGQPWHAYVYRSYGLHWCFNIVAAEQGAVLIRALAPEHGIAEMISRRGTTENLCSGPGRLAQALGLSSRHSGLSLAEPPFALTPRFSKAEIVCGPRIGISKAVDHLWRFGLAGSPYISRPFQQRPTRTSPSSSR